MKLNNKVILITWASEWIGRELALRLAQEHCQLALLARDKEKLEEIANLAKQLGAIKAKAYPCDVRKSSNIENTINSVNSDFWYIDILINNAGIRQKVMPVDQLSEDEIQDVISTNLLWVIHTTRLALPVLRSRPEAIILNIVSKSGILAQEWQSVYTASKYGVRGFTEVLKADLKWTTVKVAWVYQSGTNTEMFKKAGENFSTENFTDPADLADVIVYMLSRPEKIWLHDIYVEK